MTVEREVVEMVLVETVKVKDPSSLRIRKTGRVKDKKKNEQPRHNDSLVSYRYGRKHTS